MAYFTLLGTANLYVCPIGNNSNFNAVSQSNVTTWSQTTLAVWLVTIGTTAQSLKVQQPSQRKTMKEKLLLGLILLLLLACGQGNEALTPPAEATSPTISAVNGDDCQIFPPDNIWNTPINQLPVHPRSNQYIAAIGQDIALHPDFGSGEWDGGPIGIPYVVVPAGQPPVPITFIWYEDQSDPGPYPVPPDAPIEGGPNSDGDRHVLVMQQGSCHLYELYYAWPQADNSWEAGSGAIFDLNSHALRPDGWTSADAAGLPILPGLVRYEEVMSGEITHALRFTVPESQQAYLWPARHFASDNSDPNLPPMGLRVRLKASFDISGYPPQIQVILTALKKYGMFVADNGSPWFINGVPNEAWDNDQLVSWLATIHGSDFEAVDESGLMVDPNSGQARLFEATDWAWLPLAIR